MSLKLSENMLEIFNQNMRHEAVPYDYFSWGRDKRHIVDGSEDLKINNRSVYNLVNVIKDLRDKVRFYLRRRKITILSLEKQFKDFENSYNMMSNEESKRIFCETLLSKYLGERYIKISSFTEDFIARYEVCSKKLGRETETLKVYKWLLKKATVPDLKLQIYTAPTLLNIIENSRCYKYISGEANIAVKANDIVIDCGVGWGDTTVYLASLAGSEGKVFAFDIVQDAFDALKKQIELNPKIKNIEKIKKAVTNINDQTFYTTDPSPAARIVDYETPYKVLSITIDKFVEEKNISTVDFIKMDIEGAERDALRGAENTIRRFKPKLAISVYHLNDDYSVIPDIIKGFRKDYEFYLDCTTGFGGETILFCI